MLSPAVATSASRVGVSEVIPRHAKDGLMRLIGGHLVQKAVQRIIDDHDAAMLGADKADLGHMRVERDQVIDNPAES